MNATYVSDHFLKLWDEHNELSGALDGKQYQHNNKTKLTGEICEDLLYLEQLLFHHQQLLVSPLPTFYFIVMPVFSTWTLFFDILSFCGTESIHYFMSAALLTDCHVATTLIH
jgi:hypothetical protein